MWKLAEIIVKESIWDNGKIVGDKAEMAAKALFWDLSGRHPSYSNTTFAIACWMENFLHTPHAKQWAFDVVLNGVTGYFQWETQNGGKFSVQEALIHLGIMKEHEFPEQWNRQCTGHNYWTVAPEILLRIAEKFNLPFKVGFDGELLIKKMRIRSIKEEDHWEYKLDYEAKKLLSSYPPGINPEAESRLYDFLRRPDSPPPSHDDDLPW